MREKYQSYRTELSTTEEESKLPLSANILDPVRVSVVCDGPEEVLEVSDNHIVVFASVWMWVLVSVSTCMVSCLYLSAPVPLGVRARLRVRVSERRGVARFLMNEGSGKEGGLPVVRIKNKFALVDASQ
eukprot:1650921-Rhodomonas_salina.1